MDTFYRRFVLLDLFAKIVPGSIILLSLALFALQPERVWQAVLSAPWWILLVGLGVSWTVALAAQAFGESIGLLRDLPKTYERGDWYKKLNQFEAKATESQSAQAARLLVIKEACGNGAVALAVGLLLWILERSWPPTGLDVILFMFGAAAFVFLVLMHREHVERHRQYVEASL